MTTTLTEKHLAAELSDPAKGYVVIKNYFTDIEVDRYRDECQTFLEVGPVCYTRINSDTVPDYVHPRSHDREVRTYRIYQYLHNRHSASTTAFFNKPFALRNKIEKAWIHDGAYRAERLSFQDYNIVTKYVEDTGYLPRHRDYAGPALYPLLQSLILLSHTPEDYTGGEFTLFPRSGAPLKLHRDLGVGKGDLLIFDKSLYHSVDVTRRGRTTNMGRWSVLVGARAPRDTLARVFMKRALYTPPRYPFTRPLARLWRLTIPE
jgi:hypothetical protein